MKKVCFVIPHAYALFDPTINHPFGGSEVQTWILARGLARVPGYQVSYVVLDHKQAKKKNFDNIRVYRHSVYADYTKRIDRYRDDTMGIPFKQHNFPFIAFKGKTPFLFYESFYVRLHDFVDTIQCKLSPPIVIGKYDIHPAKFKTYRKINADVYITSGVHELSAEVAVYCEKHHKKHILLAASDYDFNEEHREGNWNTDRYMNFGHMCWVAITHASAIVTQTAQQAKLLKAHCGRESTIITNPVDLLSAAPPLPYAERNQALWIGKADEVKRPDLLVELARHCPEIKFMMVMNRSRDHISDQIIHSHPENVEIREFVPFQEMEQLFSQAFVLINTSIFEGFPNTFLQAGKYRMPILTLNVDPDGFVERENCGIFARGDFDKFISGLKQINENRPQSQKLGENAFRYVLQNHNLDDKVAQLCQLITK